MIEAGRLVVTMREILEDTKFVEYFEGIKYSFFADNTARQDSQFTIGQADHDCPICGGNLIIFFSAEMLMNGMFCTCLKCTQMGIVHQGDYDRNADIPLINASWRVRRGGEENELGIAGDSPFELTAQYGTTAIAYHYAKFNKLNWLQPEASTNYFVV